MQNSIVSYSMHLRRTNIVQTRGFQFEKHFILVYFFPRSFFLYYFCFGTHRNEEKKKTMTASISSTVYMLTLERFKSDWSQHGAVTPIYIFRCFLCRSVCLLWTVCMCCVSCYVSATAIQKACIKRKQEERNNP